MTVRAVRAAVLHAVDAVRSRAGAAAVNGALWLVAAVALQATLGVLTLLNQVPMDLALSHQAVAIACDARGAAGRTVGCAAAGDGGGRTGAACHTNRLMGTLAVAVGDAGVGQAIPIGNGGSAIGRQGPM